MNYPSGGRTLCALAAVLATVAFGARTLAQEEAASVKVNAGSVTFEVSTNVFSTTVQGESRTITGATRVHDGASALRLEQVEATVPVTSLRTGIKLRDEHMRKYIFETPEGQLPDVRFSANAADCPQAAGGGYTCTATGELAIRGTPRPFAIALKVVRHGDGYKVTGDGKLALSSYGIERPSQFGVRTEDEVRIHLELDARNIAPTTARVR
jgi:polyisoprenoid-binding protein YceI